MSPRAKRFKAGSIIYFEKDRADSVFLLKEGKVNLIYDDIQIGEKVVDQISTGEFFGVKSGLIRYPREETAKVVIDSIVFEFSANEFEGLVMKNTKIILKMLKAFSNQLRKVGKQVQSMVSNKVASEPADEFFNIGEYYLKNKKYKQAITVYQRYKHYYPNGKYAALAEKRLELSKNSLNTYGDGGGPVPVLDKTVNNASNVSSGNNEEKKNDFSEVKDIGLDDNTPASDGSKYFYKAISYMRQSKFIDAFALFKKVLQIGNEEEKMNANYEIGKCLFHLKKYNESINHLSNHLAKYPGFQDKNELLFFLGSSYASLGNRDKAEDFFSDVLSLSSRSDKIYRKAEKALKELG